MCLHRAPFQAAPKRWCGPYEFCHLSRDNCSSTHALARGSRSPQALGSEVWCLRLEVGGDGRQAMDAGAATGRAAVMAATSTATATDLSHGALRRTAAALATCVSAAGLLTPTGLRISRHRIA